MVETDMMISRRWITAGLGGLIASLAVGKAASTVSVKRVDRPIEHKEAEAKNRAVFTICDWDPIDFRERPPEFAKVETDFLIKIHLSQSWQTSW
jgi:hypothetical protein